ncbi:MAG: type II toxin-antitoxin system VapC family toxin [Bacteroidota bacterium]|nr:type II toxin-antitoxin system VapC family toxin [Bacteroidota bacterium]
MADTNTVIYLSDKHPVIEPLLDSECFFSFITEIELLGKPGISPEETERVKGVLSVCRKVPHEEAINEITIALKQRYKIKVPDALIAATALHLRIPLLTFDTGFTRVKELDMVLLES